MPRAVVLLIALCLTTRSSWAQPVAARPRVEHGTLPVARLLAMTTAVEGDVPFLDGDDGLVVTPGIAGIPFAVLGIRPGDRLVAVNGESLTRFSDLRTVVRRSVYGRVLYLELIRKTKPVLLRHVLAASTDDVAPPADAAAGVLGPKLAGAIRTMDETTVEIDRAAVDEILANPMAVAKGARVLPSSKNGVANGFKLYAIRPGSIYARLGFSNGDTVQAINGLPLDTMEHALEAYAQVRNAHELEVSVLRRGKPIELTIRVR